MIEFKENVQSHEEPVDGNGVLHYNVASRETENGVVWNYCMAILNGVSEEDAQGMIAKKIKAIDKETKLKALDSIVVKVDGKVFDGNEKARLNMLSAIQASSVVGIESTYWKLADNTAQEVTVDELKQALALSIQRVGEIIV